MKTFVDIKIENSICWNYGEITLEWLITKIYNNYLSAEITTSESIEHFENIINQIGDPNTLLELTLNYVWNDYKRGVLTMQETIQRLNKIVEAL